MGISRSWLGCAVLGAAGRMVVSRGWLGCVVLLWSCSLVSGTEEFLEDVSDLHCGSSKMRLSLPSVPLDFASAFTVLDYAGKPHRLQNDSTCGLSVGQKPDGSMIIGAAYDGCFVREENGGHVMTLIAEQIANGQVEHHKRDIRCPLLPAMDAPSPSDCAAVQSGDRLPCANSSVTRVVCEGLDCCFSTSDPSLPCYYGNKVTAQCTDDGQVLIAISKDVTTPSLILDSVGIFNVDSTSCPMLSVLKSSSFILFQFPLSCGGASQISDTTALYENTVYATKDIRTWQGSSITRDSTLRLTIRCIYSRTGVLPMQAEVLTLPPPLPVSTSGPLLMQMRIAQDVQYASYYLDTDYPVVKMLRDPVSLEVRILQRTDPNLFLILNDCWATPSTDPTQQVQWPILVAGCPFTGDNYLTQLVPLGTSTQSIPFPTHYQRFVVSTFTFVDQGSQLALDGLVYFHCSASVCVPSAADSCTTSCGQRKKRAAKEPVLEITISKGPVDFINSPSNSKDVMSTKDVSHFEMLNGTSELDFIGAEKDDPMNADGDLDNVDKTLPIRVKGTSDPKSSVLTWLRGAAAGGGILVLLVTILGVRCHHRRQSPTMHTVNI
ncbi:zona pellucida sperm-binding protein 4-like [Pseudophryne corroboree]|uniref:zona pellucida sperm-binding protein 4-like n=1 Tax=Pseudophryne corroboree TaxID=495146 RepID=UPI003081D192